MDLELTEPGDGRVPDSTYFCLDRDKTIIKNGGILENEVERDGSVMQRYWITLP